MKIVHLQQYLHGTILNERGIRPFVLSIVRIHTTPGCPCERQSFRFIIAIASGTATCKKM